MTVCDATTNAPIAVTFVPKIAWFAVFEPLVGGIRGVEW